MRDSAAMLDQYQFDRANAFMAPPFEGSYLEASQTSIQRKLKIAFTTKSPIGMSVHEECKEAVYKCVKLLEDLGHYVEEKEAPIDGKRIANCYFMLYFAEVASTFSEIEKRIGRKVTSKDVEPTTWMLGLLGKAVTAEEFLTRFKILG